MSSSHTNASAVVQEEVFKLEEQVAGMHLTLVGNVNTRRMSQPDMGFIFHIKNQ